MFVIAAEPAKRNLFYATWDQLKAMAASGRWDVQVHAGAGHRLVRVDAAGRYGPMYAYRSFARGRLESLPRFERTVTADIDSGRAALAGHIPGFQPLAFAAPYGNVGGAGTNDPRIPRFMSRWLLGRFRAVFVQSDAGFTTPRDPRDALSRHEIHTTTTTDALYAWLRAGARDHHDARSQR
jgi:hypothetical protein